MVVTKEEARKKRCPFAFARGGTARSQHCITDACMGWRQASLLTPEEGYCGMAGPPQFLYTRPPRENDE